MKKRAGSTDDQLIFLILPSLDQVTNLGTDSVPDTIGRGVKDSTERLDRDMGVSADGLGDVVRKSEW